MSKQTAVEWFKKELEDYGSNSHLSLDWNTFDELCQQAKEMEKEQQGYSEEDMISFAEFVATHPDKNRNVYGEMLHAKSKYDGSERTIDLLEQFKKK